MHGTHGFTGTMRHAVLSATILACTLGAVDAAASTAAAQAPKWHKLELKKFGSFFVGGRDQAVPYRSGRFISSTYEQPDVVKVDQMYVQYMIPEDQKHKFPVIFAHGAWHTGKTWEETPDGREGWVNYFAFKGCATYWVDKPWRARSAFSAQTIDAVARGFRPEHAAQYLYHRSTGLDRVPIWACDRRGEPGRAVPARRGRRVLQATGTGFQRLAPQFACRSDVSANDRRRGRPLGEGGPGSLHRPFARGR